MKRFRKYGEEPYDIAVIHGGPGAPGDAAKLARDLSEDNGVIEPLLSSESIKGQVGELKSIFKENCDRKITLIGHSAGAWLGIIFSSKHPDFVKKLFLVSCGPLKKEYESSIMDKRLQRLNSKEKDELYEVFEALSEQTGFNEEDITGKLDRLMTKTDSYDLIEHKNEVIGFQPKVHKKVLDEFSTLREKGKLIEYVRTLECSVTAIHGDYDPHPYEGVKEPLSDELSDFNFFLLQKCGHYPWYEKYAKNRFYKILKDELD